MLRRRLRRCASLFLLLLHLLLLHLLLLLILLILFRRSRVPQLFGSKAHRRDERVERFHLIDRGHPHLLPHLHDLHDALLKRLAVCEHRDAAHLKAEWNVEQLEPLHRVGQLPDSAHRLCKFG